MYYFFVVLFESFRLCERNDSEVWQSQRDKFHDEYAS